MDTLTKNEPADVTGCRVEVDTEPVDCGDRVRTRYFRGAELVRQDIEIKVSEEFMARAVANL